MSIFPAAAIILPCLLSAAAHAAAINLTGRVTGSDGKGVPGVLIKMKHQLKSTLTDADGNYKLDDNSTGFKPRSRAGFAEPVLRAGRLSFSVADAAQPVVIRAYDLLGNPVATLAQGALEAGNYDLDLSRMPGRAMLFIRARVDGRTHTLRHFPARPADASAAPRAETFIPTLAKAAAAAEYDTLLASKDGYTPDYKRINSFTGANDFFLVQPKEFWGDPTAVPPASLVMTYRFLNRTNGKYADKDIHWKFTGLKLGTRDTIPSQSGTLADKPLLDLPLHHAGRVTFSLGGPNGEYVDFMEQTADNLGWHGNTTRVDAYVLPMAMRLICSDRDELLGEKYEVFYLGREKFFQRYLASVPEEFKHNADASAKRLRITAPGKGDLLFNPGQKYGNYFEPYFQQLGIAGQPKVTTQFAFACQDSYFNESADLCGAINRHVAHLPKAQWRNPENFYQQAPANFYSKFIHDYSFREKAYGFAYDDAAEMAAYSECLKPKSLIIAIGF